MITLVGIILFFANPTWAAPSDDCGSKFQNLSFDEFDRKLFLVAFKPGYTYSASDIDVKKFWREGWPAVKEMARENETSAFDIIEEYFIQWDLLMPYADSTARKLAHRQQEIVGILAAFRAMENVAIDQKLKSQHWQYIKEIFRGFKSLAQFASLMERTFRTEPSFDPFAAIDRAQIQHILDALENVSLDHLSEMGQRLRGEEEKPTEAAAISTSSPPLPIQIDEPVADQPVERRLAEVLKRDLPLRADVVYSATNAFNNEMDVLLEPGLLKGLKNGESEIVRRLLRGILLGKGFKSGIKKLAEVGKGIVELKAVMHGHKRIFGCMEGRRLTLKFLMDVRESRGSYAKRIPANLCTG